ncbi:MAG: polyphosphate kinase 1 [Alistipes sp.]|nr:polyphosphate kinase 1 [Alistipes sp.]
MDYSFNNRELSWLSFNRRVLKQAEDRNVPLLSRLQFLGIFSSNLDEFFKVRVANLMRMSRQGGQKPSGKGAELPPRQLLAEISHRMEHAQRIFDDTYRQVISEIEAEGIVMVDESSLSARQTDFCREYFSSVVAPRLAPIILRKSARMPYLSDDTPYLAIEMQGGALKSARYAVVGIPVSDACPRFVVLPPAAGQTQVIMLDDIVRSMIDDIFFMFDYGSIAIHSFRIVRDAELTLDDDVSKSMADRIAEGVKERRYGLPVGLTYDRHMPAEMLEMLRSKLHIRSRDMLSPSGRYQMMRDLTRFPTIRPDLIYPPVRPIRHRRLPPSGSVLQSVSRADILLNFPYYTFQHVVDMLREAAVDPRVESIRMTLYRTARHSKVVNALINAARNGKHVEAVVELKARFDEERNVENTDLLQNEGVHVVYTIDDLKVHAKAILIERREGTASRGYAYVGTGNFNEQTAGIYCDFGLMTADKRIIDDIRTLFRFLSSSHRRYKYRHLLVSPFHMRDELNAMIDNEMHNARRGRRAYIFAKCNSLTDEKIIRRLYAASRAGVEVRLIVRGACCLRPGVEGMSERIRAVSIVDKYLEHARLYIFCNRGQERVFIGSADLMSRNLDRRVEVCAPIFDRRIAARLHHVFDIGWSDNIKACDLSDQERNPPVAGAGDGTYRRSQTALEEYYKDLNEI